MKIVILDGYTANPGDLSWSALDELGEVSCYERTAPDQVLERIGAAEAVITNKVPFAAERLQRLPGLKYVGVTATGFNIIDVAAAREQGVTVTNIPAYSTASVAQLTFALLLELTQQVGRHAAATAAGKWAVAPDFCFWETPLLELEGMTLGLVGFGQIGQRVTRIARAFGMKVLVARRPGKPPDDRPPLAEVLPAADVLTLHCPLTEHTRNLIDAGAIALMKQTAFLINCARGGIVDESALLTALQQKRIAGAAMDVLSIEPPRQSNPLLEAGLTNLLITPHVAWASRQARQRIIDQTVENIRAFKAGKPIRTVLPAGR